MKNYPLRYLISLLTLFIIAILILLTILSIIELTSLYPELNVFSLWMSDLATTNFGTLFNTFIVLSSVVLCLFYLSLFEEKISNDDIKIKVILKVLYFLSCFLHLLGFFLIGLFPVKEIGEVNSGHVFGAFLYWIFSTIFWCNLAYLDLKNRNNPKKITVPSIITAFLWIFFLLYLFLLLFIPFLEDLLFKIPQWLVHFSLIGSITIRSINKLASKNHAINSKEKNT